MRSNKNDNVKVTKRTRKVQVAEKVENSDQENSPPSSRATLDDKLNQDIVRMLQVDGRRAYKEIAEALNVSEGTIRNRVNWMRDAGMLQIAAIADPSAFKYTTESMLGVKVASTSTPKDVAARLGENPEVVYILWVTGRYDLLAEVVSDDGDILSDFLEKHCFNQTDISSVEVMTGLVTYKNQFLLKRDLL